MTEPFECTLGVVGATGSALVAAEEAVVAYDIENERGPLICED